jgi:hypothetical protein
MAVSAALHAGASALKALRIWQNLIFSQNLVNVHERRATETGPKKEGANAPRKLAQRLSGWRRAQE